MWIILVYSLAGRHFCFQWCIMSVTMQRLIIEVVNEQHWNVIMGHLPYVA